MLNVYFCTVDDVTLPILAEIRRLRSRSIRVWFDDVVGETHAMMLHIKDKVGVSHARIDNDLTYLNWDIENVHAEPLYNGLKHLISRCIADGTDFVCIDSRHHCNDQLVLFVDAVHKSELPDRFVKVPVFDKTDALFQYCADNGVFSFTLDDVTKFERCRGINPVQGAPVFRELSTGRYWYKDMLHKTHYEVFDPTGKLHVGEANMEGHLDMAKRDKNKKAIV